MPDGAVLLYGSFQNINKRIEFENASEQISFDISHVLRRPVTSLGLIQLLEEGRAINRAELSGFVGYVRSLSLEMDQFPRELDRFYREKKKKMNSIINLAGD
ncbi:hypothetical protein [uncultured Cyclobacterium sp.]|uniref:hypothetical protein n=1 Tax=uncultured Cyclobacterium sp. TaxID=453820 RepID=UPI0030EB3D5C|tara:strand:+ start:14724 stop:15029 length:306 start_codon:yes stop_codon:yes gene_type:complete